jgi:hypothetical protein
MYQQKKFKNLATEEQNFTVGTSHLYISMVSAVNVKQSLQRHHDELNCDKE